MDASDERMQRYLGLGARIVFSGLPSLAMLYWILRVNNVHSLMFLLYLAFVAPVGALFGFLGVSSTTSALNILGLAIAVLGWWFFFFWIFSLLGRLAAIDVEAGE